MSCRMRCRVVLLWWFGLIWFGMKGCVSIILSLLGDE